MTDADLWMLVAMVSGACLAWFFVGYACGIVVASSKIRKP